MDISRSSNSGPYVEVIPLTSLPLAKKSSIIGGLNGVTDDLISLLYSDWLSFSCRLAFGATCRRYHQIQHRPQSSMQYIRIETYRPYITSLDHQTRLHGLSVTHSSRIVCFQQQRDHHHATHSDTPSRWAARLAPFTSLTSLQLYVTIASSPHSAYHQVHPDVDLISALNSLKSPIKSLNLIISPRFNHHQPLQTNYMAAFQTLCHPLHSLHLPAVMTHTLISLPPTLTSLDIQVVDWPPISSVMNHLLSLPLQHFGLRPASVELDGGGGIAGAIVGGGGGHASHQQHAITSDELLQMANHWLTLRSLSLALRLNLTSLPSPTSTASKTTAAAVSSSHSSLTPLPSSLPSLPPSSSFSSSAAAAASSATPFSMAFASSLKSFSLSESNGLTSALLDLIPSITQLSLIDTLPLFDVIAARCTRLAILTVIRPGLEYLLNDMICACMMSGRIDYDYSFHRIAKLQSLQSLTLDNCLLRSQDVTAIMSLASLTSLTISLTSRDDGSNLRFRNLPYLTHLTLRLPAVSSSFIQHLGINTLPSLQSWSIDHGSDDVLAVAMKCSSLRCLYITSSLAYFTPLAMYQYIRYQFDLFCVHRTASLSPSLPYTPIGHVGCNVCTLPSNASITTGSVGTPLRYLRLPKSVHTASTALSSTEVSSLFISHSPICVVELH